jgi:hypothetical protein
VNEGKLFDEASESKLETPTILSAINISPKMPDLSRRKLISGAAGIAPVLLTLRSGSLAAASSCTGVKLLLTGGATDANSQFTAPAGSIVANDACATAITTTNCATNKIASGISGGYHTRNISGNTWVCEQTGGFNGGFQNRPNIAILSVASAASLHIV